MTAADFAEFIAQAKFHGTYWDGLCPAHDDTSPSLTWTDGDKGLVLKCHRGCSHDEVCGAAGVPVSALFADAPDPGRPVDPILAMYDYVDEHGAPLFQVVRTAAKKFFQRRPTRDGGWVNGLGDTRRVLYHLDRIQGQPEIAVVEGEKDCDRLWELGIPATTNPMGAGKWTATYTQQLVAAGVQTILLFRDNDTAGVAHADTVAQSCLGAGRAVRRVVLPDLPPVRDKHGEDVVDWLATHSVEALRAAMGPDAPALTPEPVVAWPGPAPMPAALPPVPAFDWAMVPPSFVPWLRDIAERTQCPPDYATVAALCGAGAVLGRQLTIRPKRQDDWTVVANVWGAAIGPPGMMKSPAQRQALKPLQRLVAEAHEAYQLALEAFRFDEHKAKVKKELLQTEMKAAMKAGGDGEAYRDAFAALERATPVERRYLVNDATIEKLGELLNENPNGLLQFRDELVGFLRMMDRDGHENDRAFLCEAWNGLDAYVYDRIERGTLHIPAGCVAVLGGIQPGPLHAYLREAFAHGHEQDDGFIQRFQLMVWPDVLAEWQHVDRWPDTEAKNMAFTIFRQLATLDPDGLGAHRDSPDALPYLHFTPEAQTVFDAWWGALEGRLRTAPESAVLIGHLGKYRSLMPALALLFHVIECVAHGRGGPASADAATQAIAWCRYLEAHARRVYASITAAPTVAAARLGTEIQAGKLTTPFLARTARLKGWTGLTEPEEVAAALAVLEELHWVRAEEVPPTAKGGRRTIAYHINPAIWTADR